MLFMFRKTSLALVYEYFQRVTRMHSAVYAMARCLSIRLSVTSRYCIETAKPSSRNKRRTMDRRLSFSVAKDLDKIKLGHLSGVAECIWWKINDFRPIFSSISQAVDRNIVKPKNENTYFTHFKKFQNHVL